MRILIVAMAGSIHTARWIKQINDQGWDIHLFPTDSFTAVHPDIKNVRVHIPKIVKFFINLYKTRKKNKKVNNSLIYITQDRPISILIKEIIKKLMPDKRSKKLSRIISKIKPDIVHSMHIQEAGYFTLEAKNKLSGKFPLWIVSNWGSDIDLFGRISGHCEKIKEVLANCDYYSCECKKDTTLAKKFGFKGRFLPVVPNSGGIDFDFISKLRKPGLTSERKVIMLKGYQGWSGRALVGLRALERCSDILRNYKILIYSAEDFVEVKIAAQLLMKSTGIKIEIIPNDTPHEVILSLHGKARISIGLSITDAISTSMLEAMVMGSFPVQSNTSCANEWFENGKTGILVEPEDPENVEKAIRRALTDDSLVNKASELNYSELHERLEYSKIKAKVIGFYKDCIKI